MAKRAFWRIPTILAVFGVVLLLGTGLSSCRRNEPRPTGGAAAQDALPALPALTVPDAAGIQEAMQLLDTVQQLQDAMPALPALTVPDTAAVQDAMQLLGTAQDAMQLLGTAQDALDTIQQLQDTMPTLEAAQDAMDAAQQALNLLNLFGN